MEQNQQNIEEKLVAILDDNGFKYKENGAGSLIFDSCFSCGRSKKLYVDKVTGVFHCFRCEVKGNAVRLIASLLGISFKEAAKKIYGEASAEDVSIEAMRKEISEAEEKSSAGLILNLSGLRKKSIKNELKLPDSIKLTDDYHILNETNNPEAWNYLIKRGYTPEVIKKLKLYVLFFKNFFDAYKLLEKKYKPKNFATLEKEEQDLIIQNIKDIAVNAGRIIFPLYVESELYGYIARDYTGKNDRKVLNSKGNWRSNFFWNFDNAKNSSEIIICEGATSAVKCGIDRSIALLGKVATSGQIKLLKKMSAKKAYFCLDIGTDKEQQSLIDELNVYYLGKLFVIRLPSIISLKQELSENVLKILNNIEYKIEGDFINIDYDNRKELYKVIIPRFKREIGGFSVEDQMMLEYLGKKGEYKDAGDYSPDEMEHFKQNAAPYTDIFKI